MKQLDVKPNADRFYFESVIQDAQCCSATSILPEEVAEATGLIDPPFSSHEIVDNQVLKNIYDEVGLASNSPATIAAQIAALAKENKSANKKILCAFIIIKNGIGITTRG